MMESESNGIFRTGAQSRKLRPSPAKHADKKSDTCDEMSMDTDIYPNKKERRLSIRLRIAAILNRYALCGCSWKATVSHG